MAALPPRSNPTVTAIYGRYIIAAFVIFFTAIAGMSSVAYMDVAIGSLVTVICVASWAALVKGTVVFV